MAVAWSVFTRKRIRCIFAKSAGAGDTAPENIFGARSLVNTRPGDAGVRLTEALSPRAVHVPVSS